VADGYTAEEAAYNKAYYERNKQLKGRQPGKGDDSSSGAGPVGQAPPKDRQAARAAAAAQVKALNAKLTQLRAALQAARASSSGKSDPNEGKSKAETDAKKKADNKEYYNKNKTKIANDRKAEERKSGGSSSGGSKSSSSSSPESSSRSVEEIESAIRSTLTQLKAAVAKLRSL